MAGDPNTGRIREWRSVVTLIVFVFTNIIVLIPFHIPIFVPRLLSDALLDALSGLRIIPPRQRISCPNDSQTGKAPTFIRLNFPLNFVVAPLVADLFLLAILAIGRQELHDSFIGANNISPINIYLLFLSLAYITISLDASGSIRYLTFKLLQRGGNIGHRQFLNFYLYFFGLACLIGNDPVILSGTTFLVYMTRASSNIIHPIAWIYSQFAVANIASTVLISSNLTNLVIAQAFNIKFIHYTANMVIPVVITAILLFPFLLYIIFADEYLIPSRIQMHELSEESKAKMPVNPNIPNARGTAGETANDPANEQENFLSLEEIMNPFLDKEAALFGAVLMAVTLITLLALNAATKPTEEKPIFWIALPAAALMFFWDVAIGWARRNQTREIARIGRREVELARTEQAIREEEEETENAMHVIVEQDERDVASANNFTSMQTQTPRARLPDQDGAGDGTFGTADTGNETLGTIMSRDTHERREIDLSDRVSRQTVLQNAHRQPSTLVSLSADLYRWLQETVPTATAVVRRLPFTRILFTFLMFILVQALRTAGWIAVFAHGWDNWVNKTGTMGAIGGMSFLSVILCNFGGTNIGASILLSSVVQGWQVIHTINGIPLSSRTFWGTVYSMALGVNYGAFSASVGASLSGLMWRDILARKHIYVRSLEFARVNVPIITIAMAVGCVILVGEVYIMRDNSPYDL